MSGDWRNRTNARLQASKTSRPRSNLRWIRIRPCDDGAETPLLPLIPIRFFRAPVTQDFLCDLSLGKIYDEIGFDDFSRNQVPVPAKLVILL